MQVLRNPGLALLSAGFVALIVWDNATIQRAKAQESSAQGEAPAPSEKHSPSQVDQPSVVSSEAQSEPTVDQPVANAPRPDPVFQSQTVPPPELTLAEKRRPEPKPPTYGETTYTHSPPPDPVESERPPAPDINFIWVPGFWYWYGVQYYWIPGRWIAPRPGYIFIRPHWSRRSGVWIFVPGGWTIAGSAAIIYPFDFDLYIRPWLRHHRHYNGHYGSRHHRAPLFGHPRPHRSGARITTRRATRATTRARPR
ncbi:MAG: YXWGXW repeat-containing protein [Deltaproteobacteria bacterium]|nr:YXWGXW repeat-containing protein [Deltaproteobacteria bacterium]